MAKMTEIMYSYFEMLVKLLFQWEASSRSPAGKYLYGHRRSIVRTIGTLLPLARAKRVHLDLAVWNYNNGYDSPSSDELTTIECLSVSTDEGHDSPATVRCRDGVYMEKDDVKKLMQEIMELKMKMNEILQMQANRCTEVVHSHLSQKPSGGSAPPPPPPPPPLPVMLIQGPTSYSTPVRSAKGKPPCDSPGPSGLNAVLNELKSSKISLKPVKRSPGGRPLQRSPHETPPIRGGDSLAEILKKRLSQTQYSDTDGSSISSDWAMSPDRGLCFSP